MHTLRLAPSSTRVAVVLMIGLLSAAPLHGQLRGQAPPYHQTYGYGTRLGVGFGHAGEVDGTNWSISAGRLFPAGMCDKLAVSAEAGAWNPPGAGTTRRGTGGAAISWLLNACPHFTSIPNPTLRLYVGGGATSLPDGLSWHVPIGVSIGWKAEVAGAYLEPWILPRLHYRQALDGSGDGAWFGAGSLGVIIGWSGRAGLHAALDCCHGGAGGSYGFSVWF